MLDVWLQEEAIDMDVQRGGGSAENGDPRQEHGISGPSLGRRLQAVMLPLAAVLSGALFLSADIAASGGAVQERLARASLITLTLTVWLLAWCLYGRGWHVSGVVALIVAGVGALTAVTGALLEPILGSATIDPAWIGGQLVLIFGLLVAGLAALAFPVASRWVALCLALVAVSVFMGDGGGIVIAAGCLGLAILAYRLPTVSA